MLHGICVCVLGGSGAHCERMGCGRRGEYTENEGEKECDCGSGASVTGGGDVASCFSVIWMRRGRECVCV